MAPFLAPPSLIVLRVYHMLILAVPEKPNANINYPGIIHFVGELGKTPVSSPDRPDHSDPARASWLSVIPTFAIYCFILSKR